MAIALDIILILIAAGTAFSIIKRGFVRTVLDFAAVICAVIFSKMFSSRLSTVFYDTLFNGIGGKIKEGISKLIEKNDLPSFLESNNISSLLSKYNIELSGKISLDSVNDSVDSITGHIVGLLSYAIAFLIIFVSTIIVFKILSMILGNVFKLPVLKTINKTLSVILAVIMAVLYVMLFVALMQIITPFLSSVFPDLINTGVIDRTFIFKHLYYFEWIKIFVN